VLKLLALVVAIVMLLAGITYGIDRVVGPAPREPDGGVGPDRATDGGEVTFIHGRVTWKDLNATLDGPFHVGSTSTLRIEGSDLTVLFEDLVLSERPWFDVQGGGVLELVDSTLTLTVSPQLERAVMSYYYTGWGSYDEMNRLHGRFAYLSRVLDLVDAQSPVLSFNVSWRGTPSDLIVVREPSPGAPMTVLSTIKAPEPRDGAWDHCEVDLTALAGGMPRVTIAPLGREHRALLISDLRVLDGGRTPKGDSFPTGIATEDGWEEHGFGPAIRGSYGTNGLQPLVASSGEVRVRGSAVLAPGGIPRWSSINMPSTPSDIELERDRAMLERSQGADIDIGGLGLDVVNSSVEQVPIAAHHTSVDVSGSKFVGSADMMTLDACTGSVEGSRFITVPAGEGTSDEESLGRHRDFDWTVACQKGTAPQRMVFRDDTFIGSDVALDLDGSNAEVHGCAFDSVKGICVWDHQTTGLDGWEALRGNNTFSRCAGDLYLRSHDCALVFTGPDKPPGDHGGNGGGYLGLAERAVLPSMQYVFADEDDGVLYLPTTLVDGGGAVHTFDNVTVVLGADWTNWQVFVVPSGSTTFFADFPARDTSSSQNMTFCFELEPPLTMVIAPGPRAGEVVVYIAVVTYVVSIFFDLAALHLRLRLDGSLVRDWDLMGQSPMSQTYGILSENLTLSAGTSEINASLVGDVVDGPEGFCIFDDTHRILRVTDGTMAGEVGSFLDAGGHALVLDPGVEAAATSLPTVVAFDAEAWTEVATRTLDVTLFDGSRMVVGGQGLGPDERMRLGGQGNGTLDVSGIDCKKLVAGVHGSLLRLTDVRCDALELTGSDALGHFPTIVADRLQVLEGLYFNVKGDLTFLDSVLTIVRHDSVGCDNGTLTYIGTTLRALDPVVLDIVYNGRMETVARSVTFQGCELQNITLDVPAWVGDAAAPPEVRIEGCTFSGGLGYLVLLLDQGLDDRPPWPRWLTVGNDTFDGAGTGVTAPPGPLVLAMGSCDLRGGATALAAYDFQVRLGTSEFQTVRALPPFSWRSHPLSELDGIKDILEQHVLLDVTGVPARAASPGSVDLIIGLGYEDTTVWFASPDALSGGLDIVLPVWGDVGRSLIDLVYRILDDSSFWSR
jgi:hypothetical protein